MKDKDRFVQGHVLFSGFVAAKVPREASFRFAIYSQQGGNCRMVLERERVYSQYAMSDQHCDKILAAFDAITQSLADAQGHPDQQGDFGEW